MPFWPIPALTPSSRCPHGVRIYRGDICGICHGAAKTTQHEIEAMPAPEPENPEDRIIKKIAFFTDWLLSHPEAPTRMKLHIARQRARLEAELREWMPTSYKPSRTLKGGKG